MTRILEGTWEEIKTHDTELTGLKLRVIIESADDTSLPPSSVRDQAHLEELLLEGLHGGSPIPVNDEYWESKRQRLTEEFRRKNGK